MDHPPTTTGVLLRLPEVFLPMAGEILSGLGAVAPKALSGGFFLVKALADDEAAVEKWMKFVRWKMPVHHAWPCKPREMDGFVEKAARAIHRKFAAERPQAVLMGALDAGSGDLYFRRLASNLRGRTLQLFGDQAGCEADAQEPEQPGLFCLVGKEGLFCGMCSPREANGFHTGGTKFIRQSAPEIISRAGAKIAEALHYLRLHREPPPAGSHWLELGASPGGMTSELLNRGYRVTAVDRAALDPRLDGAGGLVFFRGDVAGFQPPRGEVFDALLSDMNGAAEDSIRHVARLSKHLKPGGLVVFTLKGTGAETVGEMHALYEKVLEVARAAMLFPVARTHLTYNRLEFTLFFEAKS